jgi:LytS/YehU family sensor histidine kinase
LLFRQQKISRQKEKAELIQQNLTVEHDLLQLQMNPHFIFNALNSIQSFISDNDSYQAELFLSRFANLMRYYLDSSSKKWVGFNEEINALKTNLELERLRMNKSFDFDISIPYNMDVEELEIPPMLMQPFIENSVKHGFRNKASKGQLDIGFELVADVLICTITDNGIGREKAAKFSKKSKDHQSKGVKLTNERLEKHNRKKGKNYFIRIVDLYDKKNNPSGTKVVIRIPVQYA